MATLPACCPAFQEVYSDEVYNIVSAHATVLSPVRNFGGVNNVWTHYEQVGQARLLQSPPPNPSPLVCAVGAMLL